MEKEEIKKLVDNAWSDIGKEGTFGLDYHSYKLGFVKGLKTMLELEIKRQEIKDIDKPTYTIPGR